MLRIHILSQDVKEVRRHYPGKTVQTESSKREKLRGGRMPTVLRGQQVDQRGWSGRANGGGEGDKVTDGRGGQAM